MISQIPENLEYIMMGKLKNYSHCITTNFINKRNMISKYFTTDKVSYSTKVLTEKIKL